MTEDLPPPTTAISPEPRCATTINPTALLGVLLLATVSLMSTPAAAASQSLADTMSVYRAVLESHTESGAFVGPEGEVRFVCAVTASAGMSYVDLPGDSPSSDTLADFTPRLRELVLQILEEEYGLVFVEGCDGYRTPAGERGIRVGLSGLLFMDRNRVDVYAQVSSAGVWGRGARCDWVREAAGQPWKPQGCAGWVSE